jgi:transcriptional regulator with GAF, ATPase, and Fis domain
MTRVRELIAQVAPTEATVLVTGESGTGKELVANEIHRLGTRAERALVRVNCAAVPETLFESEFFGHRRGSFSGAIADRRGRFAEAEGGTLVLDEIGTLQPEMQAKLLRVLETGEYQVVGESSTQVADVRSVAITYEDLSTQVGAGRFRDDLYYRLANFPIELPPLRAHREDIPEIAVQLLTRTRSGAWSGSREEVRVTDEALEVLASYSWPGNVRELRNVLERALILVGPGRALDAHVFRPLLESSILPAGGARAMDDGAGLTLRPRLDALERELVLRALERTSGKKKEAANLLGIDPRNLGYYLRKHDLKREDGA